MVGYKSGGSCEIGSNNTFLGALTQFKPGISAINGSIGLGYNAIIDDYNQLMVGLSVTSFNISGLAASTGTGEGTILEFDSSGNIIPSTGTYNTVSSIDTEFSSLQSSVSSNTSNINTLLAGGTIFTTPGSGSYTVPSNVTTLTIEAIGGGGGGAGSGSGSDGAWDGGGGGSSGLLEKITIPVTSGQVISFNIGTGGTAGTATSVSGSNGGTTTVSMYGQIILTAGGGAGSPGIDGGGLASTASGISCCGGGGMGSVNTSTYGTGGTGTFSGSSSTIYETLGTDEQSGNGGLNNLGQPPDQNYASGMGGAGGGPNGGYSVASSSINTGATNGTLGCGGGGAFGGATQQVSGGAGGNGYVKISIY